MKMRKYQRGVIGAVARRRLGGAAPPLSIIVSPSSLSEFDINCPITTGSATGTASGGAGGYSYAWDWSAGGTGLTINSPSSQSTTVTQSGAGFKTGTLRCTVTDDDLDTAADTSAVDMECGT